MLWLPVDSDLITPRLWRTCCERPRPVRMGKSRAGPVGFSLLIRYCLAQLRSYFAFTVPLNSSRRMTRRSPLLPPQPSSRMRRISSSSWTKLALTRKRPSRPSRRLMAISSTPVSLDDHIDPSASTRQFVCAIVDHGRSVLLVCSAVVAAQS